MSYLVLARKYRPQNFNEIVGQKPVVKTLKNALLHDRVAHAMLFSGIRGTGKTTLARLMAKAINCENLQQSEPCNACFSCIGITEGSNIDLQEVDGASNRGIQEIRELKDKIRFQPSRSKYKIIIIDEVHMLTTEAFNALLKTLEEPPDHVFFMFATTEIHKVPVTILSRCQRYELKRLTRKELEAHFALVAEKEKVSITPEALGLIVQESNGSVRDGLSILDQVFSYCDGEITAEEVIDILGVVHNDSIADLVDFLLEKKANQAFSLFENICLQGTDLKRLSKEILEWLRNVALYKSTNNSDLFDLSETDVARIKKSAEKFSLETITLAFTILLGGLDAALRSSYPKLAIELLLIKMVHAGDVTAVHSLIQRFNDLLAGHEVEEVEPPTIPDQLPQQQENDTSARIVQGQEAKKADSEPELEQEPESQRNRSELSPRSETIKNEITTTPITQPSNSIVLDKAAAPEKIELEIETQEESIRDVDASGAEKEILPKVEQAKKTVRKDWDDFLIYVKDRQPWVSAALQGAASVKQVGKELVVHFEDSADCSILKDKKYINPLTEYALDFFQETLTIQFVVPGSDSCAINPENIKKPQQERKMLANDPLVLMAQEIFNGQVGDIRIGPRFRHKVAPENEKADEESNTEVNSK